MARPAGLGTMVDTPVVKCGKSEEKKKYERISKLTGIASIFNTLVEGGLYAPLTVADMRTKAKHMGMDMEWVLYYGACANRNDGWMFSSTPITGTVDFLIKPYNSAFNYDREVFAVKAAAYMDEVQEDVRMKGRYLR